MKTRFFIGLAALALSAMSCTNDNEGFVNQSNDTNPVNELNLQSLSYMSISSQLNDVPYLRKQITLVDKGFCRKVTVSKDERTEVAGMNVQFYNGETKDSTTLILGDDFAVVRFYRDGDFFNYITYNDERKMEEIATQYVTSLEKTRSMDKENVIEYIYGVHSRSNTANLSAIKVNITKAKDVLNISGECRNDNFISSVSDKKNVISTRAIPETPKTVYVICLKENGATLYANEVSAQMLDAANAIYALNNANQYINLHFVLNTTEFSCPDGDAYKNVELFKKSLSEDPRTEGFDDQIYFLLRWGGWDSQIVGMAYTNSYNVDYAHDFKACGISATSIVYTGTLAHELGHIFGAEHVDDSGDLMYYRGSGNVFHKDASNITKISHNFGWSEEDW